MLPSMTATRPLASKPTFTNRSIMLSTHISLAESDSDILRCYRVMSQLRPHLSRDSFVERVRGLQENGYMLAFAEASDATGILESATEDRICAVAGYRVLDQLVSGRILYIDDLVTDSSARSRGFGDMLLKWLLARAAEEGCTFLELDSGVERSRAHRFYFGAGLSIIGYHFRSGPL